MEYLSALVDYGILGLLVVMSMTALAVAIERHLSYRKINIEKFSDKRALEFELTRRLHLIATIGSNAPYIGLLGTVLGIMATFYTMGMEGFADTGKIMVGLSMALKATAVGLLVAIPSIVFYNLLLRRVKGIILEWELKYERR
jgi:biopolymer transport protein ExbB